ncbi:hypothetical protein EX30DRAFT_350189 [Ascodesmis nigricans]|uniref:Uncharacterized protein n=1 Tax=Ascodesmis nigricans TaxID=341454 RepID=A0A4S2MSV8_9PEZI|nr:hypothetical protein EX30DRAFT_350189 [Ascodesmis nigricans]
MGELFYCVTWGLKGFQTLFIGVGWRRYRDPVVDSGRSSSQFPDAPHRTVSATSKKIVSNFLHLRLKRSTLSPEYQYDNPEYSSRIFTAQSESPSTVLQPHSQPQLTPKTLDLGFPRHNWALPASFTAPLTSSPTPTVSATGNPTTTLPKHTELEGAKWRRTIATTGGGSDSEAGERLWFGGKHGVLYKATGYIQRERKKIRCEGGWSSIHGGAGARGHDSG